MPYFMKLILGSLSIVAISIAAATAQEPINFELGLTPEQNEEQSASSFRPFVRFSSHVGRVSAPMNVNYVAEAPNSTGTLPNNSSSVGPGMTADDLLGDGITGSITVLVDLDGDGTIDDDEILRTVVDNDDLHTVNVFYDTENIDRFFRPESYEITKQHIFYGSPEVNQFSRGWRFEAYRLNDSFALGDEVVGLHAIDPEILESVRAPKLHQFLTGFKTSVYGSAGVRFLETTNSFYYGTSGTILGSTEVDTTIYHTSIAPQLAIGTVAEKNLWRFEATIVGAAGYQRTKYSQTSNIGTGPIPGALNRSPAALTTSNENKEVYDEFGWITETRLSAGCQLTKHIRLDAILRYFITGPYYDPSKATVLNAPSFGITQPRSYTNDGSDFYLGMTLVR